MTDGFVEVYAKSTGAKQIVPEHYLNHPVLGRNFSKTPSAQAHEQGEEGGPTPEGGMTADSGDEQPSEAWTRERLDQHAAGLHIDSSGLANKGEVLQAIEAATQNSTGNPPGDQTPAAGENQE